MTCSDYTYSIHSGLCSDTACNFLLALFKFLKQLHESFWEKKNRISKKRHIRFCDVQKSHWSKEVVWIYKNYHSHEVKTAPSWLSLWSFQRMPLHNTWPPAEKPVFKQLSIPILKVQFSTFSGLLIQLFTSCAMNHQNDHLKTDTFNLDHFSDPVLQSSLINSTGTSENAKKIPYILGKVLIIRHLPFSQKKTVCKKCKMQGNAKCKKCKNARNAKCKKSMCTESTLKSPILTRLFWSF